MRERSLGPSLEIQSVDTNILLRVVMKDVPSQYEKVRRLIYRSDAVFYVDDVAISEAVYVLEKQQHYSREFIVEYLSGFLQLGRFVFSQEILKILRDYLEHPKLSFNDCYLAEKAKSLGREPLWTFDRKLVAQMGAKVPE